MKKSEFIGQPSCPHCGGTHYGQRFDNCPYVEIVANPDKYTEEQVTNSKEWLRQHAEDSLKGVE